MHKEADHESWIPQLNSFTKMVRQVAYLNKCFEKSKALTTMTDLQIDKWVQEANDDTNREFRQAVHTTLLAISSDNALKNNMDFRWNLL